MADASQQAQQAASSGQITSMLQYGGAGKGGPGSVLANLMPIKGIANVSPFQGLGIPKGVLNTMVGVNPGEMLGQLKPPTPQVGQRLSGFGQGLFGSSGGAGHGGDGGHSM